MTRCIILAMNQENYTQKPKVVILVNVKKIVDEASLRRSLNIPPGIIVPYDYLKKNTNGNKKRPKPN